MIQRDEGLWVADREALATWLRRPISTIRKHCPIVGYHPDGRALYDMFTCEQILASIPTRRGRSVP